MSKDHPRKPMTPKKCMSIARSLTNNQHMELEPLCTVQWGLLSCSFWKTTAFEVSLLVVPPGSHIGGYKNVCFEVLETFYRNIPYFLLRLLVCNTV